jgi:hypothetical protein
LLPEDFFSLLAWTSFSCSFSNPAQAALSLVAWPVDFVGATEDPSILPLKFSFLISSCASRFCSRSALSLGQGGAPTSFFVGCQLEVFPGRFLFCSLCSREQVLAPASSHFRCLLVSSPSTPPKFRLHRFISSTDFRSLRPELHSSSLSAQSSAPLFFPALLGPGIPQLSPPVFSARTEVLQFENSLTVILPIACSGVRPDSIFLVLCCGSDCCRWILIALG